MDPTSARSPITETQAVAPEHLARLSYQRPIVANGSLCPRIVVTEVTRETLSEIAQRTTNQAIREKLLAISELLRKELLVNPALRISTQDLDSAFNAFLQQNPAIAGKEPLLIVALSSGDLWVCFQEAIEVPYQRLGITPTICINRLLGLRISRAGNVIWDIKPEIAGGRQPMLKWRDLTGYHREIVIRAAPDAPLNLGGRPRYYGQCGGEAVVVDARTLLQGQPLTFECPFTWSVVPGSGRVLTNGTIHLPSERPKTNEDGFPSEIRFAQGVSAADWKFFLRAVKGCYLDGVLPPVGVGYDFSILKERIRAIKNGRILERDDTDTPSQNVECFVPPQNQSTRIDLGENIVFVLQRQEGQPLYLVDAPRTCALYVFESRSDAVNWATRSISFSEARARSFYWLPHISGWQKEISDWLAQHRVLGY